MANNPEIPSLTTFYLHCVVHCTTFISWKFIETERFTKVVKELETEESLRKLQLELVENPSKGALLQRTGGSERFAALPDRGKSGLARVIYPYLALNSTIIFAALYLKKDRDTLSHEQEKQLQEIAKQFKS